MITRRRITLAALAATTMFALALPPLVGSQGQRAERGIDRCADNGGRTVAATRSIRVYIKRGGLGNRHLRYCWVPTGRTSTLQSGGPRSTGLVPLLRLAGRYLGHSAVHFDDDAPIEPGVELLVSVRDVKRDRCIRGLLANPPDGDTSFSYDDADPGVTDLELTSQGGLAWIVAGRPNRDDYFYVQKADGTGRAVLDEGTAIEPRSLAISGRRIYWMSGGTPRTAVLDGLARDPDCD